MKHTIKSIPESERPYEKCLRFGAEYLTDSELLAIILRTGFQGENSLNLAAQRPGAVQLPEGTFWG